MEWLLAFIVILGLLGLAGWLLRGYIFGDQMPAIFGGSREKRIGVSDAVSIDGRRKLVLIYRDGVEHLIMTGGPVDMLIEQNIVPHAALRPVAYERPPMQQSAELREAAPQAAFGKIRARSAGSSLDPQ